jgi:hypothetical protein
VPVGIRNDARVHLWCADSFGSPAPPPFPSCAEAIDAFAAVCCSVGVTRDPDGRPRLYAPYGLADPFDLVVRPNRRQAPRHVYEAKAARWQQPGRSSPCCLGRRDRLTDPRHGQHPSMVSVRSVVHRRGASAGRSGDHSAVI